MTISQVCSEGREYLMGCAVPDYSADAMLLLKAAFSLDSAKYLLKKDETADEKSIAVYRNMLERRAAGEPVQYIIGEWDFCGHVFSVGEGVLIPRPETEQLCDIADGIIKEKALRVVFDLCSGSGCIGISLALQNPDAQVFLFEISEAACGYIKRNIEQNAPGNVSLIKCDILSFNPKALPEPDMIISNPPYIPSAEIAYLQNEVKSEPRTALDGGEDGLMFYRSLAGSWLAALKKGGCLALECGENQAEKITEYLRENTQSRIITDMYGVQRFVIGYKN